MTEHNDPIETKGSAYGIYFLDRTLDGVDIVLIRRISTAATQLIVEDDRALSVRRPVAVAAMNVATAPGCESVTAWLASTSVTGEPARAAISSCARRGIMRSGEKRENWLLRKVKDSHASDSEDLVGHALTSVLTDRSMAQIQADSGGTQSLKGAKGKAFADKMQAASSHIRDHLGDIGLVSFAMLSGGKGVHVVVPLTPGRDWDTHKDFAARFAQALSTAEPDRFVATMSKAKRKNRIFIDWLRNQRGSTAILPYSARARSGAPVAVPIDWDELADMKDAHPFDIDDAVILLKRAKGLKGWGFAAQGLPEI